MASSVRSSDGDRSPQRAHDQEDYLAHGDVGHDDLLPKGKGGVQDISDDIGTNDKYSEALSSLIFKLLFENKSHSSMWEFLELSHTYSVDLTQLGKVAQTLVFKKHSDKNFDFVDYMERKGLKITLPSTKTNPSQSGAAGTSTSGEGSKKLKGKALVKKLNVVTPKKPTTGTVEAPKKPTTGTLEAPKKATTGTVLAPKKSTGTVQAPKLKMDPTRESNPKKGTPGVTPELQASKLISGTSADTTGQKAKTVKFIHPTNPQSTLPSKVGSSSGRTSSTANAPGPDNTRTSLEQSVQPLTVNPNGHSGDGGSVVDSGKRNLQVVEYNDDSGDEDTSSKTKKRKGVAILEKKSGFQPECHVVETDQVAADVKMQLDPKTKD
ncbi:hypothetical protein R1sor_000755 [Riccia sorocarpa]|uniref:Uncharacterized protein n=1 Tax=Riccia sorocarpa TaxID=122646 RepID=A0ABD3GUV6_9MARC